MGAEGLSNRAFIGEFFRKLEQDSGAAWIVALSMLFDSDQASEEYKWLGQSPAMQEFIGGRKAKGFRENGLVIANKHYEATIEVTLAELRRDKSTQVMTRIRELAQRTETHWASLMSTLVLNGVTNTCYDGQYFFDTDHSEGDSGTQSNKINVDISTLPASVHGVVAAPSVEEMQQTIVKGIAQILGYVDDQGEPINETASHFVVMVPVSLWPTATKAINQALTDKVTDQRLPAGIQIDVVQNPRLSSWTDKFAIFRADGDVKPFIRQEETKVQLKVKGYGSDYEFDNDSHQYGVDVWRNVGYGYWQHACLVTMI